VKRLTQTLQRLLVALAVFAVCFASPGCVLRLVEGAPGAPISEGPVLILEPKIPEYDLLVSRRRQEAIERASRIEHWEAEAPADEEDPAFRKQVYREQALRQGRLDQVADMVPRGYRILVLDAAARYEVDPRLLAAVSTVESRWHARALGRHGDSGLMQIIPGTASFIARGMGLGDYDIFDPFTNLTMGAWYLDRLRRDYGSWGRALAAYNGGPKGAGLGDEHPYAVRVMQVYRRKGSNMAYVEASSRGDTQ
jgi:soluble lytic murein transglycosylase-like protein